MKAIKYLLNDTIDIRNIMIEDVFIISCKKGHLNVIKYILFDEDNNIDINSNNDEGFRYACENGHLNVIQYLLSIENNNININSEYDYGFRYACANGHLNIIKYLLSIENNNIDINSNDDYAFKSACCYGHLDVVKYLLSIENNNIDIHNENNCAFRRSCENRQTHVVKYLTDEYLNKNKYEYYYYAKRGIYYIVKPLDHITTYEYIEKIYDNFKIYCDDETYIDDCVEAYKKHYNSFNKKSAMS